MILIWLVALTFSIPFFIFAHYDSSFNPFDSSENKAQLITVCQVNAESSTARAFITWFIILMIFVPFVTLLIIYSRIIFELGSKRKLSLSKLTQSTKPKCQTTEIKNSDSQRSRSVSNYRRIEQKRMNSMIICVVTVAFFFCQFPARIIQLIEMYGRVRNETVMPHLTWIWIWKLSKLLFFLNFTANPVWSNYE